MQRRSMGFAWRLHRDGAAYLPWPAGRAVIVLAAAERRCSGVLPDCATGSGIAGIMYSWRELMG